MIKNKKPAAILVYETDKFHSLKSRVVIGCFTDKQKHYWFIKRKLKAEIEENWDENDRSFHQGYSKKEYLENAMTFYDENKQSQHLWNWELESEEINLNEEIL